MPVGPYSPTNSPSAVKPIRTDPNSIPELRSMSYFLISKSSLRKRPRSLILAFSHIQKEKELKTDKGSKKSSTSYERGTGPFSSLSFKE